MLNYPSFFELFKCPKCEKAFEPAIVNLSAETVELNKEGKIPQRTSKYRDISVVICSSCDTVIGVLPVE